MAAVWKRLLIAGGMSGLAAFAAVAGGLRISAFGLEPEATLLFSLWPLAFAALSAPPCRRALAWAWPDFPACLDPDLERDDKVIFSPYARKQSFIGRGAVMNRLVGAVKEGGAGFRWGQAHGAAGMGKTRLGLEWLKALRGRGWDVGALRSDVTPKVLREMIFRRRPTAVLIDDADCDPAVWEKLDALAARSWKHPLRVLLTSAAPLSPPDAWPEDAARRLAAAVEAGGAVAVARLNRHDVAVWAAADDFHPAGRGRRRQAELPPERLTVAAGGRPFFLKLLAQAPGADNPWRLLAEQADKRVTVAAKALGPRGPALLALAALAGPFPLAEATDILEAKKPPRAGKLMRALPESAHAPPATIPAVQPGLLAAEIALRVLAACDPWERERLGERAFALNPAAAAARFAVIDAERPEVLEMFRRQAEDAFAAEPPPAPEPEPEGAPAADTVDASPQG